jgi:hypothetical protein
MRLSHAANFFRDYGAGIFEHSNSKRRREPNYTVKNDSGDLPGRRVNFDRGG